MADSKASRKRTTRPAKIKAGKPTRLTPSERRERILDVAIRLAEEGGFENVRQRDVAKQAGVALGTLYKDFRGKGAILSAALERETTHLEQELRKHPIKGPSVETRLAALFEMLTYALCRKPNYARAVIRAMASGDPEIASNIVAYQAHVYRMVVAALRGHLTPDTLNDEGVPATESEMRLALMLQQMWFSQLVGWSANLLNLETLKEEMALSARVLVAGMAAIGNG